MERCRFRTSMDRLQDPVLQEARWSLLCVGFDYRNRILCVSREDEINEQEGKVLACTSTDWSWVEIPCIWFLIFLEGSNRVLSTNGGLPSTVPRCRSLNSGCWIVCRGVFTLLCWQRVVLAIRRQHSVAIVSFHLRVQTASTKYFTASHHIWRRGRELQRWGGSEVVALHTS